MGLFALVAIVGLTALHAMASPHVFQIGTMAAMGIGYAIGCPMALTTEPNLRQSNSAYNNLAHEDLMDVVERVDPAETPCYTMAGRENELGNTEFSWEVDSWPTPLGAQGPGDGYDVQDAEIRDVSTAMRKMGNYGQAFRRAYGAGWIANQVPRLPGMGRGGLISKGAADAAVLLKQDIECAFCSLDQVATPDQGGATGSTMAGMRKLIDPANKYANASSYAYGKPTDLHPANASCCVTGALASVFNLALVKTVTKALRKTVKRNGDYFFLAGLDLREAVTGLVDPINATASATGGALSAAATQTRVFTQSLADAELGVSIDVIRTDYGRLMVIPTDFVGTTTTDAGGTPQGDTARASRVFVESPKSGYIGKRDKLFKRIGVPFDTEELPNSGGGKKKVLRTYQTLGVGNPQGFGFFSFT